ncbi:uncharacterized protein DUF2024 [Methylobacter tundripaludum]|uniref:Uncharacterized protein DUF2024 n=1 Tax=Methylobacter tundripaludum TaxID=173365 RepID=A0A2S6H8F3_9GAMM|nr:DUF2024 family protein [Methylobacter tundripaludum]PPK73769.1 uncharacterized protein DUF2024 [Methylobacter tundripaludum]
MTISHVFDTYAKTAKGRTLHFNVILDEDDQQKALGFAKQWLASINLKDAVVTPENCYFYHSLEAPAAIRADIDKNGYAIYKMEGCPK